MTPARLVGRAGNANTVAAEKTIPRSIRPRRRLRFVPAADISDFFMFRSYEPGKQDKVVLIMDVHPGEEPSSGPNYYGFDQSVVYSFHVDNDRDGEADDVRFD